MIRILQSKTLILLAFITISHFYSQSQTSLPLYLRSGEITIESSEIESKNNFTSAKTNSKNDHYRIIQFYKIPSTETIQALNNGGIELLSYLPKNAYYAYISSSANWELLNQANLKQVLNIDPKFKLTDGLSNKRYPKWALKNDNSISLNGAFFSKIPTAQIEALLLSFGATEIEINSGQVASFTTQISELENLYKLSAFYYFEPIDPPSEPENLVGVTDHRSNTLATSYTNGLHLDGTGVTVMLQDNSRLDDHIDYTGRFINHSNATNSGDHGEHCGGTIAGAGNLDPVARGMAPGAEVLVYSPSDANYNSVPNLVLGSNLTITSKSYGGGLNLGYNTLASILDQQTRNYPELIHVFSAGNSNGDGPTAAGSQWYNITGGHKSAKNVLAVGNVTLTDVIAGSSSRGPSEDGRIKPDICAVGTNVYSTVDPNTYDNKTGTSMACPGVAGTIAQLYQGYKELNGGVNPDAALIKGSILNTADDLGNVGPDFIYGWGRINARRAYNVISSNTYFTDDISQGDNFTHSISVPAGTDQLRVMVYWSDYEASTSASQVLVNDINMNIISPTGAINLPWTLDNTPNAAALSSPAIPAVDDINNVEQVTIDNPTGGIYTVNLEGFSIPFGPQKYFVVYEFVTNDVVLTYPIGGEGFDPIKSEMIRWDALGDSGVFHLEYSVDSGITWATISSNIQGDRRYFLWNVPSVVTGQALIRINRGNSMSQSHEVFSIISVPQNLQVLNVCLDSVTLTWNPVIGATGYEVSILGNLYMDSVGTSSTNTITVAHSVANDFWWSVKALGLNNCEGRRAIAKYQSNGPLNCNLDIDIILLDSTNLNGRSVFSCSEIEPMTIGITIINNSSQAISNIPINYELNNTTVSEIFSGPINPNDSIYYTFVDQLPILPGSNSLSIWSSYAGDQYLANNDLDLNFTYINANAESLPYSEDFETFILCGTNSDCEAEVCELENNFINSTNGSRDDIDWRTNRGTTNSTGTGPSTDFNPGTSSGTYLYLEASECFNKNAHLITPCLNIVDGAILTFAYHMYGSEMGELHVDVLVNGVWTNDVIPPISGNKGTFWKEKSVNLNTFAGNIVNIRFRGVSGNAYRSDMAIDDINVTSTLGLKTPIDNAFKLYPNPTNGRLFYEYNAKEAAEIMVMDVNGKIVFATKTLTNSGSINLSNLEAGIYFVKLNGQNQISTKKIIVQ